MLYVVVADMALFSSRKRLESHVVLPQEIEAVLQVIEQAVTLYLAQLSAPPNSVVVQQLFYAGNAQLSFRVQVRAGCNTEQRCELDSNLIKHFCRVACAQAHAVMALCPWVDQASTECKDQVM